MNGLKQMILAATRKARSARAVPLMVPHGGADAEQRLRECLRSVARGMIVRASCGVASPVRIPFGRAS